MFEILETQDIAKFEIEKENIGINSPHAEGIVSWTGNYVIITSNAGIKFLIFFYRFNFICKLMNCLLTFCRKFYTHQFLINFNQFNKLIIAFLCLSKSYDNLASLGITHYLVVKRKCHPSESTSTY